MSDYTVMEGDSGRDKATTGETVHFIAVIEINNDTSIGREHAEASANVVCANAGALLLLTKKC